MDSSCKGITLLVIFILWTGPRNRVSGLRGARVYDLPREYALYHWAQLRPKFPHCNVPTHYELADVNWSSDSDVYYFPLLHPQDEAHCIEAVLGRKGAPSRDPNSVCLTKQWSFKYPNDLVNNEARVRAWGYVSAPLDCQQIGTKFAYDCITDNKGLSHRVYMLRPETDDQDWHLAYTCWESGVTGWSVYSQIPHLSPATKASVLRRVKTLGFQTHDLVELNYEACTSTHGTQ